METDGSDKESEETGKETIQTQNSQKKKKKKKETKMVKVCQRGEVCPGWSMEPWPNPNTSQSRGPRFQSTGLIQE